MPGDAGFSKYWIGQTFSVFGSNIAAFALVLLATYFLEAGPRELGWLQAMSGIPFLLFSLFIGVMVDRVRRLRLMIAADFLRAALIGLIPVFYLLDWLTIWHLYLVALGIGVLSVMFETAYQAFLPGFVGKDRLVGANSALQFSQSLSQISGPGAAGFLVNLIAAPLALIANGLMFLASAVALARIRFREALPDGGVNLSAQLRDVTGGLRVLLGHAVLRPLTLAMGFINLFFSAFLAAYYPYLKNDLGFTSFDTGLVLSVGALGAVTAVFAAGRMAAGMTPGMIVIFAEALFALGAWLVPLAGGPRALRVAMVVGAALVAFFGGAAANIMAVTICQKVTPDRLLGRVSAASKLFLGGSAPIGAVLGGYLADGFGLRPTLFIAAVGISLMVAWMLAARLHKPSEGSLETEHYITA
jgi:MFS family permease